jgi:hypothetical protein
MPTSPRRPLLLLAAILALAAGCTTTVSGTGRVDPVAPVPAPSRSPAPMPTPRYNGVASMSGDEAMGTAYDALRHARSVRMKGTIGSGSTGWSFDLRFKGADSAGVLTLSGLTLQVRKVGRWIYRKAGREFWRRSTDPATAARLQDRWVQTPATDSTVADLAGILELDSMAESLLGSSGTLSTGIFRTVNGVEAVPVTSDGAEKQTVWVAIVGKPYPVRVVTRSVRAAVDLVEYDRPVTIASPPPGQVVRFAAVPGG